jgi:hypothetical protein
MFDIFLLCKLTKLYDGYNGFIKNSNNKCNVYQTTEGEPCLEELQENMLRFYKDENAFIEYENKIFKNKKDDKLEYYNLLKYNFRQYYDIDDYVSTVETFDNIILMSKKKISYDNIIIKKSYFVTKKILKDFLILSTKHYWYENPIIIDTTNYIDKYKCLKALPELNTKKYIKIINDFYLVKISKRKKRSLITYNDILFASRGLQFETSCVNNYEIIKIIKKYKLNLLKNRIIRTKKTLVLKADVDD